MQGRVHTSACLLWGLALLLAPLGNRSASAQLTVTASNFDAQTWLSPQDEIRLRLSRLPEPEEGHLVILIGETDVTSQIGMLGGQLTYRPDLMPLPSGEISLIVYLVLSAKEWNEIARFPLKVLTPLGFERAQLSPSLNLNMQSRITEGRNKEAGPAGRASPYGDTQVQAGLRTEHERSGTRVQTAFDVLGSSRQQDALRFGELQNGAPKLDLSSYLLNSNYGGFQLSVGHLSYGNHRHLLNNVANRGLVVTRRFGNRFDLSFNTMSGRSIVGYDNFLGLSDITDNNIMAGTFGVDVLKNQYATLRFEGTLMRGRIKPQANFNMGQVVDAEESQGLGLRLFGNAWSGRIRTDLSFARSTFDNPNDGALSFGVDILDVEKTTNNARYFELAVDVLKNYALTENTYTSLTLTGRHERLDPQFKSLGAFTNSNQEINTVAVDGSVGAFSFQLQHTWLRDNLDDIPTILTTKTRNTAITFGIPLPSILRGPGFERAWLPNRWLPHISYGFSWTHQFGANRPSPEESGFLAGIIPDQLDVMNTVGATWAGNVWNWNFSYQFMQSFQDNRQQDRENADFTTEMHLFSLGLQPLETLGLTFGFGWTDASNTEANLTRLTKTMSLGLEWRFLPRWVLAGAYSYTDEDDSADQAINRSYTLETQLAWEFSLPSPTGKSIPGRVFVRHALQSNMMKDRRFHFASDQSVWIADAGISLSLF